MAVPTVPYRLQPGDNPPRQLFEYTVHFQRGSRVGARSLRMVHVNATCPREAINYARAELAAYPHPGRIVRVDHFEGNRLVIDR